MQMYQQNTVNLTALVNPGVYVVNGLPAVPTILGQPTNRVGFIGTAQWGPVNKVNLIGSMSQYAQTYGAIQNRVNDMGTYVAINSQLGGNNWICNRITDGTDTNASGVIGTGTTVTALYTGTLGNSITVTVKAGTKAGTLKLVVTVPGTTGEVFDNIPGTGSTFWTNAVTYVNTAIPFVSNPSQYIRIASTSSTTPTIGATVTLTGGTDGASVSASQLIGSDFSGTGNATGMYKLKGQGVGIATLCDLTDLSYYGTVASFGESNCIYFLGSGPSSDAGANVTQAVTNLASAAVDAYSVKMYFGDPLYWNDPVYGFPRLTNQAAWGAGRLANLSPEQSSLNKPILGPQGSLRTGFAASNTNELYNDEEKATLIQGNIDLICAPAVGGNYYAAISGHNTSSDFRSHGDNYTRMDNFMATSLYRAAGVFIGLLNTDANRKDLVAAVVNFLLSMYQVGMLVKDINGNLPWIVKCDKTNNSQDTISKGYMFCQVTVQIPSITEFLVFNLEVGQTAVTVTQVFNSQVQGA